MPQDRTKVLMIKREKDNKITMSQDDFDYLTIINTLLRGKQVQFDAFLAEHNDLDKKCDALKMNLTSWQDNMKY